MKLFGLALILVALVVSLAPTPTNAAICQFVLGFQLIHDQIPDIVGDCLVDQHYNPDNGDALQETSKGLLVWRKADNFTAFTDGYRSWVNGPYGLQRRLNTERFGWESTAPAPPPPSTVVSKPSTGKVGDIVWAGNWTVVVVKVQDDYKSANRFLQPEAGNRFVVFDVTLGYAGKGQSGYNPLYFNLQTTNAFTYKWPAVTDVNPRLSAGTLQAGEITRGYVSYEIPQGAALSTLTYTPDVFGRGPRATVAFNAP